MTLHFQKSLAISAAVAVLATGASAATVSSVSVVDTNEFFGSNTTSDSAIDGDATVNLGFINSFAVQNSDGTSDVQAAVQGFGPKGKVTSTAQFAQEETNTFGMSRDYTLSYDLTGQSADFNFGRGTDAFTVNTAPPAGGGALPIAPVAPPPASVASSTSTTGPSLNRTSGIAPTNPNNPFTEIDDPTALPAGFVFTTAASFEYIIEVNGNEVFNARADALYNGGSSLIFDAVSGFTPSQSSNGNGFTFSVAPISGMIDLGTFAAGETISVTSTLIARAFTPGGFIDAIPLSVNTFSSDPVRLSSVGTLSSTPTNPGNPSAVPLPAAGWMLLAALGGLGLASRRKTA